MTKQERLLRSRVTLDDFVEWLINSEESPKYQQKVMKNYTDAVIDFVNKGTNLDDMYNNIAEVYNDIDGSELATEIEKLENIIKIYGINAVQLENEWES